MAGKIYNIASSKGKKAGIEEEKQKVLKTLEVWFETAKKVKEENKAEVGAQMAIGLLYAHIKENH
jgi:hypothetical protein